MKRETISRGVGNIDARYVQEAAEYTYEKKYTDRFRSSFMKSTAAAILFLAVFISGIFVLFSSRNGVITVYAYETGEEITAAGAVLHTGAISDTGEMKGHPLMFYLTGTDIDTVRFSCKNQELYFMDWTEKRDEYGNAQNFTVVYGEDESEYCCLTIQWVPDATIRELTDNKDSRIVTLPEELREDIIVMEITFGNGKTATKAITISLQDDGTFYASLNDYRIKDSDTFIMRPDSVALRDIPYEEKNPVKPTPGTDETEELPDMKLTPEQIEDARQAALAYYEGTVFSVNRIEYFDGTLPYGEDMANDCNFTVNVSKNGIVQESDRTISLRLEEDGWRVVNEGY